MRKEEKCFGTPPLFLFQPWIAISSGDEALDLIQQPTKICGNPQIPVSTYGQVAAIIFTDFTFRVPADFIPGIPLVAVASVEVPSLVNVPVTSTL